MKTFVLVKKRRSLIFGMSDEDEWCLAEQLKAHCYLNGKEKNPKESAKILHKLGIAYRRKSPDKQSLIQSVGLMTSAVLRKPENEDLIKQDLEKTCLHLFDLAHVENRSFPLNEAIDDIKRQVAEMRKNVQAEVISLQPIPDTIEGLTLMLHKNDKVKRIAEIQEAVTVQYTAIMRNINYHCLSIMGKAPCAYSLVGMGSLAKKEITPFSDFESAIVLQEGVQHRDDYHNILNYFRWYAAIFQMFLIRLGETVLRFLAIPCLNDPFDKEYNWFFDAHTPCGICPDGFAPTASKNPLGRTTTTTRKPWTTELIKPAREMARYLEIDEDLKNEYHLADVLSRSCFVAGDIFVYEDFSARVDDVLKRVNSEPVVRQKLAINAKEFNFGTKYKLRTALTMDVKRLLFRAVTLFVSTLGRLFDVQGRSCFTIMRDMLEKGLVSDVDYSRIVFSAAIACEIRLRFYLSRGSQSDFVWFPEVAYEPLAESHKLALEVGARSLAESIVTAICLQEAFHQLYEECFGPKPGSVMLKMSLPKVWHTPFVYQQMRLLKKAIESSSVHLNESSRLSFQDYVDLFVVNVDSLAQSGMLKQASAKIKLFLPFLRKNGVFDRVCELYRILGSCMLFLNKPQKALKLFRKIERLKRSGLYHDNEFDTDLCIFISDCYKDTGNFKKSLKHVDRALAKMSKPGPDFRIVGALHKKGEILLLLNRCEEAKSVLEKCVDIKVSFAPRTDVYDPWVFESVILISESWFGLGEYPTALRHLRESWNRTHFPDVTSQAGLERKMSILQEKCLSKLGQSCSDRYSAVMMMVQFAKRALEQKLFHEAILCCQEALDQVTNEQEPVPLFIGAAKELQGVAHFCLEEFETAARCLCDETVANNYELLENTHPDKYAHYYRLGCCFASISRHDIASDFFECGWALVDMLASQSSILHGTSKHEFLMLFALDLKKQYSEDHIARSFERVGQHTDALYHLRLSWQVALAYDEPDSPESPIKKLAKLMKLTEAQCRTRRFRECAFACLEGITLCCHHCMDPVHNRSFRKLVRRLVYSCNRLNVDQRIPPPFRCTPSVYYDGVQRSVSLLRTKAIPTINQNGDWCCVFHNSIFPERDTEREINPNETSETCTISETIGID